MAPSRRQSTKLALKTPAKVDVKPPLKTAASRKRKASVSDSEDTHQGISGIKMPVSELLSVCEMVLEENSGFEDKKGNTKLGSVRSNLQNLISVTSAEADSTFKAAFRIATKKDFVPLKTMAEMIQSVFGSPQYPTLLPDYPKKAQSVFQNFLQLKGITNNFTSVDEKIRKEFTDDTSADKLKAIEIYKIKAAEYNSELEDFISAHPELSDVQVQFVRHNAIDFNKTSKKSTSRPKVIKEPVHKTAYDFFKLTKKGKYTELDEKARESKLAKIFAKLSTDQKQIFNDLQENQ
uniref:HMG box domain-containing protein n=1 Tax=Rhabditophanes sp. KR3021 TaxID=114890 RepID=A0AC35U9V5_9BILA